MRALARRPASGCLLLFLLAPLAPVRAEPVSVTVQTKDGNVLVGGVTPTTFKVETSVGSLDVRVEDVEMITFATNETFVLLRDRNMLKGKVAVEAWSVKTIVGILTVKPDQIARMTFTSAGSGPPPPIPGLVPPPPPAPKGPEARQPDARPVKTWTPGQPLAALVRHPDGSTVYVLSGGAEPKAIAIAPDTLEAQREIGLSLDASALSVAPGGKTLVALAKFNVIVIDPLEGRETRTFAVEHPLRDIQAVDENTAVALLETGSLTQISFQKQAIVQTFGRGDRCLRATSDCRKFYTSHGTLLLPPDDALFPVPQWISYKQAIPARSYLPEGEDFMITPDNRYAVFTGGMVCRLGKSAAADMVLFTKLPPHRAALADPQAGRLLLFTPDGFLKEYDYVTFELSKSFYLGLAIHSAVIVGDPAVLVLLGLPANPNAAPYLSAAVKPATSLYKFPYPLRN